MILSPGYVFHRRSSWMKKPMISVRKLVKRFDEKVVIEDLNLEIEKGEFFAFLGPNGAGKTTTIKILTGLLYRLLAKYVFVVSACTTTSQAQNSS